MLNGKTAVITGASRGIGRAIALLMAQSGAGIAVIYSGNKDAANDVCDIASAMGVKAKAYQCDVANYEQVQWTCKEIMGEYGKVDILVNNAGIAKDNLLLRMSETEFDDVIGVNLKGAYNFIKHLSRGIMKSPSGRIINISSVIGIAGNIGQANYSAAKAGLIGLTKTAARELAGKGVTCNAIAPGFIETDMTAGLPQDIKDRIQLSVPLKRTGRPEEIAELAVFLASDKAAYITGEVIRIDGGMCM